MPRVNLHCHDATSSDAAGTVAELAAQALDRGVAVVCLTNHVERLLEDGETWDFAPHEALARFRACLAEIERCRATSAGVELLFGAELEYRPEWRDGLERFARTLPFDFLLGSVHVVDGVQISGGPGVDAVFEGCPEEQIYGAYFDRVLEMVRWGRFDAVSHLDVVKRFGARAYGPFQPARYADRLEEILRACARQGIGIEVNASGLIAPCREPMPGPELLARAKAAGVPFVTLGTDGHAPDQVDRGLAEVERLAREAGFRETAVLRRRVAHAVATGDAARIPAARAAGTDEETRITAARAVAIAEETRIPAAPGEMTAGPPRVGRCRRETSETSVEVAVNLDGTGRSRVATGLGFFDHMLETLARHSLVDLEVAARGDLSVDEHHLVEDVGLALGEALSQALAERRGVRRFGSLAPLDESLAEAAVDLGGRPCLVFRVRFRRERVGQLPTELVREFFRALCDRLRATLHLSVRYGVNDHHKIEALFKAFALALRAACEADPRRGSAVPSTKGTLTS